MSLLCLSAANSCAERPAAQKPLVVSSIRPVQLIVDEIAGDLVSSSVLINAATSPHDFSLTIAQAMTLSEAELLVWVGPKMESFLRSGVYAKNVLAMDVEEDSQGYKHSAENPHNHTHADAHLWLSEYEVADFAQRLSRTLISILPAHTTDIEKRETAFLQRLKAQHQANREALKPYLARPLAVYHEAYQYLFESYGVTQAISLTRVPQERLSAKRLNEAGKGMANAACLLTENAEVKQAERYAKLFELPLVSVDLLASDPAITSFNDYLAHLAQALKRCLQA